ncbi:MAG: glycoside-pentoside-hexuronide (GPH):cation symporter [Eubacteriales bacterium]|nr:glycoside-pentoside-hexuronide (GPH):cation symporter [Eubacteriales bacterium]
MSNNQTKTVRPFGWADKIGYAFGDFGNDFTFLMSSMFMLKFYTDVMGVPAAVVGTLMMVARIVDAFTDVTMGQIVDRSKPTKDGKFKPWIRRMCGPVAIASFMIFQSAFVDMSMTFKIVWMFVTYILWGSFFYTAVNIPYGSMASAISADPNDRAQLSTFRTVGAVLASLVIGTVTPMFAYVVVDGATVLSGSRITIISGIFSVCAVICHMSCFHLVTERVEVPQNNTKFDAAKMLKSLVTNRSLLGIIAAAIMLLLAMLGLGGMAPFIYPVYYNNSAAQSASSFISNMAVLLICAPFAAKIAAKIGKRELSIISCLFSALVWVVCLFVRPASPWVYIGFYTLSYIGLGVFNTIIWAMITDVIDDSEVKNGIREDGTIYAVYSFARKIGQALSSGMIGGLLGMIGYSSAVAANPSAYPEVLHSIFSLGCLIPAIGLGAVALVLILIYPLSKSRVDANVAELAKRRANKA